MADPNNPQAGDVFVHPTVGLVVVLEVFVTPAGVPRAVVEKLEHVRQVVEASTIASWTAPLPPLFENPTLLYEYYDPETQYHGYGETAGEYATGRKFVMRPNGTWTEMTT